MSTRRNKTFTGCWTCRRRHLKCDEAHPACDRCKLSSLTCEGYDMRLSWVSSDNRTGHARGPGQGAIVAGNRRALRSTNSPEKVSAETEQKTLDVKKIQRALGKNASNKSAKSSGPFHVFETTQETGKTRPAASQPIPEEPNISSSGTNHQTLQQASDTFVDIMDAPLSTACGVDFGSSSTEAYDALHLELLEDSGWKDAHISSNDALEQLDLGHLATAASPFLGLELEPNEGDGYLETVPGDLLKPPSYVFPSAFAMESFDPLAMFPIQRQLIHHWSTHLCKRFFAVEMHDNPVINPLVSVALMGFDTGAEYLDCRLALLHAMCAIAAHSMDELHGGSQNFGLLAARHHRAALHMSQQVAVEQTTPDPFATTGLFLVLMMMDSISGQVGRWREHMKFANQWLSVLVLTPRSLTSDQQRFLEFLTCCFVLCDENIDVSIVEFYLGNAPISSIMRSTGMTPSLVYACKRIQDYRGHPESHEIDELEQSIILQVSSFGGAENAMNDQTKALPWAKHYFSAFCYGMLIFLKRKCRSKSPESLQELVALGLVNLEAAIEAGGSEAGVPPIWPYLAIAAECTSPDLQSRALRLLKRLDRYSIGALKLVQVACVSVWEQRALTSWRSADIQWQDVIRDDEVLDFPPL